MTWNGIYAKDRHYPQFEPGDEVFTTKHNWKSITANKPYTVISCHKQPGMTIDIYVITLITDGGYKSEYASYQFQKTNRQLRQDKINNILNPNPIQHP
jgi:hypothetical protein